MRKLKTKLTRQQQQQLVKTVDALSKKHNVSYDTIGVTGALKVELKEQLGPGFGWITYDELGDCVIRLRKSAKLPRTANGHGPRKGHALARESLLQRATPEQARVYREYLASDRWHQRRKLIKARDCNRCQACGNTKDIEAHHRTYRNFQSPIANKEIRDCITLCRACHNAVHRNRFTNRRILSTFNRDQEDSRSTQ